MSVIKAVEIEQKFPGTGRHIGKKLAEIVKPGDIIDFEEFITITNSFADEFVKCFIAKYGKDAFNTLKFIKTRKELDVLLKRALIRRTQKRNAVYPAEINWQPVSTLPF